MHLVQDQYVHEALTAKELLSSEGGIHTESMAPMLGGGFHGELEQLGYEIVPARWQARNLLGKVIAEERCTYLPVLLDITEEDNVWVYLESNYTPEEAYRIFEVWCTDFVATIHDELVQAL